jgi:hypothetical protein
MMRRCKPIRKADNNARDQQMPIETPTRERRSHWQVVAARRYPRLTFLGGDGGDNECWVAMTRCPHEQTRHWRYALAATKAAAEALLIEWKQAHCSYQCQGERLHSLWRIYE